MELKCKGCGAKIQTVDPKLPGFIRADVLEKRSDDFRCERCYNLMHYNRGLEVAIDEAELLAEVGKISRDALLVCIVDIFDLEGTFPENLGTFPQRKKIIVANKFDLFLKSVKKEKILAYLRKFLKERGIVPEGVMLMSAFKGSDIEGLLSELFRLKGGSDICFVGTTNVGKSTVINALAKKLGFEGELLTTSTAVSTTLGLVRIPLPDGSHLLDTPGIPNRKQATYYLSFAHQKLMLQKKFIRPRVYQLKPKQTLFIGGFCRLDFLSGEASSFVVNVPNALTVHRTKTTNAEAFYEGHKDDILKIPDAEEREKLGNFRKYSFAFGEKKREIAISGLGFIALVGSGKVDLYCFEKIKVSLREAIV
ncbi:MAG: ribosome biogenesis GTPase YqeH [Bacilli bacterium]|jgi:ribosome biogenesis GTPase YqeH